MKKQVKVVRVMDIEPLPLAKRGPRVRRAITKERDGSDKIMLGLSISEPFGDEINWRYADTDEVYYMVSGEKTLWWEDQDGNTGEVKIAAGDAAFLPAGIKYRSINSGTTPYMLVYATCPPLQ